MFSKYFDEVNKRFSKRFDEVNKRFSKTFYQPILESTQIRLQNVVIIRFINQSKTFIRHFLNDELFVG